MSFQFFLFAFERPVLCETEKYAVNATWTIREFWLFHSTELQPAVQRLHEAMRFAFCSPKKYLFKHFQVQSIVWRCDHESVAVQVWVREKSLPRFQGAEWKASSCAVPCRDVNLTPPVYLAMFRKIKKRILRFLRVESTKLYSYTVFFSRSSSWIW